MAQSKSSPQNNTTSSPRIGLPTSPSPRLSQQSTGSSTHSQSSASWEHQNSISEELNKEEYTYQQTSNKMQRATQQPQHWHCCCQHHTCHNQAISRSNSLVLKKESLGEDQEMKSKRDSDGRNSKLLKKFRGAFSSKLSRQKQQSPLPSMDGLIEKGEVSGKSFSKHRQQHLLQQQDPNYTEVVIDHWAE